MIVNRRYSIYAKKSPFEAKWSELAAIGLIIPTWGAWPAMITLILIRALPRFVDDHLEWLKHPAEDKLEESCRQIALASIPWFLLCVIWTHFSLLTPLGLIEFNPSKIIVTGGFFGARTDPLIPWMEIDLRPWKPWVHGNHGVHGGNRFRWMGTMDSIGGNCFHPWNP